MDANTASSPKSKRRSPITREVGEQRLVNATLELLRERPMGEIGVRDIAARADVNHGFVHVWFGGKTQLLTRAMRELTSQVSAQVANAPAGTLVARPFDPEVALLVRLVMWITLDSGQVPDMSDMPVIATLTERYETTEGMRPDVASMAAKQAVALVVASAMYGPLIGVNSNDDALAMFGLWRHIVGLLGQYPPA